MLIADSGSTKTDWRIIDSEGQISQALCGGINPYYHDYSTILKEIKSVLPQIDYKISEVHFYGAGCSAGENINKVSKAILKVFPDAAIQVNHDLLAAARALCGHEEGIACILGTGANSCLYGGNVILDNISTLGYIMGDEGSGSYLGKRLIADYLRRNIPEGISEKIEKRFELSKEQVLKRVYLKEGVSKYLASFTKFIFQHIKEPYLYKLVYDAFGEFFEKNIMKCENYQQYQVHFTGSVAFYYSDILRRVANAVSATMPEMEELVSEIVKQLGKGGRLFYIGSGTSGRVGVVDASEIPPTFGMHGVVVGLIAGGDKALRKSVEFAEDDPDQAWKDLQEHQVNHKDIVIGIAASGKTPYVIGGVKRARETGLITGCITCNRDSELASHVAFPIEVIVGSEFVTGSTRMKAGTAQKMVLNMISTVTMIRLGHVKGNKMVDMELTNDKLTDRGVRMLTGELSASMREAEELLKKLGSVRKVIEHIGNNARN